MYASEVELNALVFRMKRLEKQNRFWKIVVLTVFLILGVSLTASVKAQQKVQDIVEAQHFLLEDAAGHLMGQLSVRDGKPMIELYDAAGKVTWSTNTRVRGLMASK